MKTLKFTGIALTALLFLGACGEKTKTVKAGDKEDATTAGAEAKTYAVDVATSSIGWVGSKTVGNDKHTGTLALKDGELSVENGEIKAGKFTIDMTKLTVTDLKAGEGKEKLEGHLSNADFFDVPQFPTGNFEITGVEKLAQADANGATHTIKGNLTLKGITKNISIPANVTISGDGLSATAKFAIDRTQWEIMYNSGKLADMAKEKIISDAVELELTLNAKVKG